MATSITYKDTINDFYYLQGKVNGITGSDQKSIQTSKIKKMHVLVETESGTFYKLGESTDFMWNWTADYLKKQYSKDE